MGWNEEIKKELGSCGKNVFIGNYTIFTNPKEVHLDDNVRIDPFCLITTGLKVGKYVQICSHSVLGGGKEQQIEMGDWTFIGYGSQLFTASEDYSGDYGPVNNFWGKNRVFRGNIKFNNYSGIASQGVIMPGVELPEGCLIGAQSFVYQIPPFAAWCVFKGNPLHFHKQRNQNAVLTAVEEDRTKFIHGEWLNDYENL